MSTSSDCLHHKCRGFWSQMLVVALILASSAEASSNNGNFYTPLKCKDSRQICVTSSPNQGFASSKAQCFTACNMVAGCGWVRFAEKTVARFQSDYNNSTKGNCELFTSQPNTTKNTNGSCLTLWQKDQLQNPMNLTQTCQDTTTPPSAATTIITTTTSPTTTPGKTDSTTTTSSVTTSTTVGPITSTTTSLTTTFIATTTATTQTKTTDAEHHVFGPTLRYNETKGEIFAVASLHNLLFVINWPKEANQISVYDTTTFELLRFISVPGATSVLYGLTVCPTTNYLYVSDCRDNIVYRIDLSSIETNINGSILSWPVVSRPTGLSINSKQNLIVTGGDFSEIQEFTPNGTLVRQISLILDYPWSAVERSDGRLAVLSSSLCLISVVDGTILNCTADGLLSGPYGLAVDSHDNMLVVNTDKSRIVAFNPTLSEARVLTLPVADPAGLCDPMGVWLDESRGRLYVGERSYPGRLLVFDNVFNIGSLFTQ